MPSLRVAVAAHRSTRTLGVTLNASVQSAAARKRSWYLLHALAGVGALLAVFLFGSLFYSSLTGQLPKVDLPMPARALGSLGVIALIWLWIRMLIDFFRERPPSHPVAWGFFLMLGSYIGALVYFWVVWRPRNGPGDT